MPITTSKDQLTSAIIKIAMGLGLNTEREKYDPYFTGWKLGPGGNGMVGQVVRWCQKKSEKGLFVAYVNLPGMESGVVPAGACFSIGDQRLDEMIGVEEIGALMSAAVGRLKQVLIEHDDLIPMME